jgi:hypothetical protein
MQFGAVNRDNKSWTQLGDTQIGVEEEHQDRITALVNGLWRHRSHRTQPSLDYPSSRLFNEAAALRAAEIPMPRARTLMA